tara:strand:+ start:81 stop:383 length:303 start_codon:yes stop_codon:yes gene_type:complete
MKELEIKKPIGDFIIKNAEGTQTENGVYYHYSEVCTLLKSYEKQLTLTDVVDSKRFTETDLLNGYQAGCIEGLDECCDLGLNDLKEIKEYGEKWVKIYTE